MARASSRLASLLVALAVTLGAAPRGARADEPTPPHQPGPGEDDAARAAEADRHFKLAVQLYNERKFDEALVEFERAYQVYPHPSVLYNIAVTYREMSAYGEAILFYERFLSEGAGVVSEDRLAKARGELDALRARVATVEITATPDGASVWVDGKEVGETPLPRPLVLAPGRHEIEIRGEGGRVEKRALTLASGDHEAIAVDVTASAPPPPPPPPDDELPLTPRRARRYGLAAGLGTNLLAVADTGAPTIGLHLRLGDRLTASLDVVLVAFAIMPSVRLRVLGDRASAHLVAALPIALTDGDASDPFVTVAGGVGGRFRIDSRLSIYAEALLSYGMDHGTTMPVFAGGELWW